MQPEQLPHLDAVVISHEHYDHCDLEASAATPGKDVPFVVAGPVVEMARKAGFSNVRALEPWQSAQVGDLTIAAAPGKHGVYEVTYVISGGGHSVYFAGDTLLVPQLRTLTDRYGPLDVALLPVNGLHIRMAGNKQVVMNAEQAAELTAALRPKLAVPQHSPSPAAPWATCSSSRATRTPPISSRRPAAWSPMCRSRSSAPGNR